MTVSVVVISHNEGRWLGATVESLHRSLPAGGEIIVVDDWSTDHSAESLEPHRALRVLRPGQRLGAVRARNFGASRARNEIIVFSDAHVDVPRDWAEKMLAPLERSDVGAVGPAIAMKYHREAVGYGLRFSDEALNCEWGPWHGSAAHPVPILGAAFMAMRRELFKAFGGFDRGMIRFGMEDPDLDIRLWTFGYACMVVPTVEVGHLFREDHPFADYEQFLHNMLRYGVIHFSRERLRRLIASYVDDEYLPVALARVLCSDAQIRRRKIQCKRIHTDDWYFDKFGMK
jgi:GT2 family glycosyltransferase